MRYIIAYKLRRKNARRRMYSKFDAIDLLDARKQFESYMKNRIKLGFEPNKETTPEILVLTIYIAYFCKWSFLTPSIFGIFLGYF